MILTIKPENCTGCLACEIYCSLAHEGQIVTSLSRIKIHMDENRQILAPVVCLPCENKHCIQACPEKGAIYIDNNGAVVINEALCTGCSRCVRACPIGAIHFHRLPGRGKKGIAVALKCDQCGGDPWCVRVCPNDAIQLVDSISEPTTIIKRIQSSLEMIKVEASMNDRKGSHHA